MNLENIKQERKCLRSAFTKNINKLDDFLKSTDKNLEIIGITFEQLNEKYVNLKAKDEKFFELFQKKGCSEEEYDKEYETAQEYYDKYSELR